MEKKIIRNQDDSVMVPDGGQAFILEHITESIAGNKRKIAIGDDCQVQHVLIIDCQKGFSGERAVSIGAGSTVDSYQIYLGQGAYDIKSDSLISQSATLDNKSVAFQAGGQMFKLEDNYVFSGRSIKARLAFEGLASGDASIKYHSDLMIKLEAQLTDARIDMKLHLLDALSSGNLLPGLHIAANDVRAGHSASTFRLSEEDMFYLCSRGLDENRIRALVAGSIASRFVLGIKDEETVQLILRLIKERAL